MHDEHRIHPQLIALHWVMALLLVIAVTAIVGRSQLPSGHEWRPMLRATHLLSGQLILGLVVVRLFVRWKHAMQPAPGVHRWAIWAGHSVHAMLYGVLLAQPITGILFLQAGGKEVAFFDWHLPRLVEEDKSLHFELKDLHQTVGTLFYALLSLHVCAALWHHVVLRNRTLHRMLPWLPVRPQAPLSLATVGASTPTVVVDTREPGLAAAPEPSTGRVPKLAPSEAADRGGHCAPAAKAERVDRAERADAGA